jgi:hypothetical protein
MRIPRIRFTLRWMMIAVAIAGLIIGAETLRRRGDSFRRRSAYHAAEVATSHRNAEDLRHDEEVAREQRTFAYRVGDETTGPMDLLDRIKQRQKDRSAMKGRIAWHESMERKYARAASRPWLSVEPDTPEPPVPAWVTEQAELEKSVGKFLEQMMGRRPAVKTTPRQPGVR